jgi:hypothetical protein
MSGGAEVLAVRQPLARRDAAELVEADDGDAALP